MRLIQRRQIALALERVSQEIAANSKGGFYSAGLASEGYAGGYADALRDVQLAMNGIKPDRRGYWDDWDWERWEPGGSKRG